MGNDCCSRADASRVVVFDIPEDLIPVESWTLVDFSPLAWSQKDWRLIITVTSCGPWG